MVISGSLCVSGPRWARLLFPTYLVLLASAQRLTIHNACDIEPLWLAVQAPGDRVGPDGTNIKLLPGSSKVITTTGSGLRYWPKYGCGEDGQDCRVGQSGGTGQACFPDIGCAPAIDTKFEASWNAGGEDYVDMSMVDGFTVPFKLQVRGTCFNQNRDSIQDQLVDCSSLDVSECPAAELIAGVGSVDLRMKRPGSSEALGCYSPCSILADIHWGNPYATHQHDDAVAGPYCCPTPPFSSEQCQAGPAGSSEWLRYVHASCTAYAYAYDDTVGLLICAPSTTYEVSFYCPGARATATTTETSTTSETSTTTETTSTTTETAAETSTAAPGETQTTTETSTFENSTTTGTLAPLLPEPGCNAPSNPGCAGLIGDCCPTPSGVYLACCPSTTSTISIATAAPFSLATEAPSIRATAAPSGLAEATTIAASAAEQAGAKGPAAPVHHGIEISNAVLVTPALGTALALTFCWAMQEFK